MPVNVGNVSTDVKTMLENGKFRQRQIVLEAVIGAGYCKR